MVGVGVTRVQGLSMRAITTVSPRLLDWLGDINDFRRGVGARLIEVWLDNGCVQEP